MVDERCDYEFGVDDFFFWVDNFVFFGYGVVCQICIKYNKN